MLIIYMDEFKVNFNYFCLLIQNSESEKGNNFLSTYYLIYNKFV